MFYTHQHTCMYIGWSQPYKYTADLLCLDFCRLPVEHRAHELSTISTPLQVDKWSEAPAAHPNQAFVCYVCDRICFGFRISFDHFFQQRSATTNMQSAFEHPGVISQHLQKELSLGHLLGWDHLRIPQTSSITNQSIRGHHPQGPQHRQMAPHNRSLLPLALCSLHYTTVEDTM